MTVCPEGSEHVDVSTPHAGWLSESVLCPVTLNPIYPVGYWLWEGQVKQLAEYGLDYVTMELNHGHTDH